MSVACQVLILVSYTRVPILIFAYIYCLVCVSTGVQICANENMGVVTRNHTPYGGEPPLLIFLEITTEYSV